MQEFIVKLAQTTSEMMHDVFAISTRRANHLSNILKELNHSDSISSWDGLVAEMSKHVESANELAFISFSIGKIAVEANCPFHAGQERSIITFVGIKPRGELIHFEEVIEGKPVSQKHGEA